MPSEFRRDADQSEWSSPLPSRQGVLRKRLSVSDEDLEEDDDGTEACIGGTEEQPLPRLEA